MSQGLEMSEDNHPMSHSHTFGFMQWPFGPQGGSHTAMSQILPVQPSSHKQ